MILFTGSSFEIDVSENARVVLELASPAIHSHLPTFDNTKLNAIATCPTDGLMRYEKHKIAHEPSRSMALEAGSACHEVFAACRLLQLGKRSGAHLTMEGERLFGKDRLVEMLKAHHGAGSDERLARLLFGLTALQTSGFFDDPSDKRRTMSNLEESCIAYIDRYDFEGSEITINPIGIELPFDLLCRISTDHMHLAFRLIGRLDGLHYVPRHKRFRIEENKTASRLDTAWSQSFRMSHQITLYMLAASLMVGTRVDHGLVHGLSIPMPKTYDYGGLLSEDVTRTDAQFMRWANWLIHIVGIWNAHKDNVLGAPQYAHSCNRYFRACQFIDFCEADQDERAEMLESFPIKEWSPLHELESKTRD